MLTTEAFNTLLKTLEEPPENLVFILATTEAHNVMETIVSRCQKFDFRRITTDDIVMSPATTAAHEFGHAAYADKVLHREAPYLGNSNGENPENYDAQYGSKEERRNISKNC